MTLHFDCIMVKWIQKWGKSTWHHHEVSRWQKDCRHHHHHHHGFLKLRQIGSNKWQWQGSYGGQGSGMPVACIEPWLPVSGQSCLFPFSLLLCKQHFIIIRLVYLSPHVTLKTWRSNGHSDEKWKYDLWHVLKVSLVNPISYTKFLDWLLLLNWGHRIWKCVSVNPVCFLDSVEGWLGCWQLWRFLSNSKLLSWSFLVASVLGGYKPFNRRHMSWLHQQVFPCIMDIIFFVKNCV